MDWKEMIERWVDGHRKQLLEWNRELVSIPSVNSCTDGAEAEAQVYIRSRLENMNFEVETFLPTDIPGIEEHPAYLSGRSYVNRPNVVGRKRGTGRGKSLLVSGHIDTVPLAGGVWSVDPFSGIVKDGKQYGLGLFDMKSGLAAALAASQALEDLQIRLEGDLLFESVVDEEFGGANGTLACRLRGLEADLAIIPEPTNLAICPGNQGGSMYRIIYFGNSGRIFSGETVVNPVFAGARFLEMFREYQIYHAQKQTASVWFDGVKLPAYIQGMVAGDVELPLFDRAPAECRIDVWIQHFPETTEEQAYDDLIRFYERYASTDSLLATLPVRFEKLIRFIPGTELAVNHPSLPVLQCVSEQWVEGGLPIHGAPFACDAFLFNQFSSTPVVIWGPKGGNAHAADEFIDVEDWLILVKLYALTMIEWCGANKPG